MPIFEYTARTKEGKKISGQVEAADRKAAMLAINRMGNFLLTITQSNATEKSKAKGGSSIFKLTRAPHMSKSELLHFTSELADLLEGGMTLGNALNCLCTRTESASTHIIESLRDSIIEGADFSDALAKHPKIFDGIYINMIKAGEASGAMIDVLRRLIEHFERMEAMRSKIISALTYPILVLIMAVVVSIFAVYYLLPKFQVIFDSIGPDGLPPMTKIMVAVSDWCRNYGVYTTIVEVLGIYAFIKWIKTPTGKLKWDKFKLKVPVIKGIVACSTFANFARTLESLLSNGVPVIDALKITAQTSGNSVIEEELLKARDRVTDGTSISGPLAAGGIFPPMIIDMIAIGERTGDMPSALGHIAKRYESELQRNINIFTSALEPILILVVTCIIAFIAISIMQAVMAVSTSSQF